MDFPGSAGDHSDAVIESLHGEIRHLRETIAYLRGSLGWQANRVNQSSPR
jgi:hypothetical protein